MVTCSEAYFLLERGYFTLWSWWVWNKLFSSRERLKMKGGSKKILASVVYGGHYLVHANTPCREGVSTLGCILVLRAYWISHRWTVLVSTLGSAQPCLRAVSVSNTAGKNGTLCTSSDDSYGGACQEVPPVLAWLSPSCCVCWGWKLTTGLIFHGKIAQISNQFTSAGSSVDTLILEWHHKPM